MTEPVRVLSVMAHQDDFEFNAGGTFAKLRKRWDNGVELKVLATTRGASGHHEMSPEETFRRREIEATKSAALIGAEYECLTRLDGSHSPAQIYLDRNTLGGLWNAIRRFAPHYIFSPPVVTDPLAGIHIDHQHTAIALRLIAYQLGVPHAFPTMNGPMKKRVPTPLIINVDDPYAYSATEPFHVANDIAAVYGIKQAMGRCHESQILEWLPWTNGEEKPINVEEWEGLFEKRHDRMNERYGKPADTPREFFRCTTWARAAVMEDMERLFPDAELAPSFKKRLTGKS